MSHPIPDPNPPAVLLNRLHRTTAAVQDHPETYNSTTLAALRGAAMELAKITDGELYRREHP